MDDVTVWRNPLAWVNWSFGGRGAPMGDPRVMTEYRLTRRIGDRTESGLFIRFVDGGGYIEVDGEASVCGATGGPDDWRVGWDWLIQAGFAVGSAPDAEPVVAPDRPRIPDSRGI